MTQEPPLRLVALFSLGIITMTLNETCAAWAPRVLSILRIMTALLLLQHSRRDARTDGVGDLVLLEDQYRARWDHDMIDVGVVASSERRLRSSVQGRGAGWSTLADCVAAGSADECCGVR